MISSNTKIIHIDKSHPAFSGHFPGNPILPGAYILEIVLSAFDNDISGFVMAKFIRPVLPGDELEIEFYDFNETTVHFRVLCMSLKVCEGRLTPKT